MEELELEKIFEHVEKTVEFEQDHEGQEFIPVLITLKLGQIVGRMLPDKTGYPYFSFEGIPYAKPPVGPLRFRAPEPIEKWEGILNATRQSPKCYQEHLIRIEEVGDVEDCLCLNVYTPDLSKYSRLFPVMVYFHGGIFQSGTSQRYHYGPEYLVSGDVVLVTVNYRIGISGFLSLLDEKLGVPGNAGLKDQVLALKWVKRNIRKFRGNPRNVTIFGNSSGAACVHFHMLSPMSKGLFHKAIMQSGCALCPWANGIKGNGKLMAQALEFHSPDDEEAILAYLRALTTETLFIAQKRASDCLRIDKKWFFAPVVETQKNEPAFLTDEPMNIIRSGNYNHVPFIIGYNNLEGLSYDAMNILYYNESVLVEDFTIVIPNNIYCNKGSELSKTMARMIKNYYYGPKIDPNLRDKMPLFNLITDVYVHRGIDRTVRNHIETAKQPIYFYRFCLDTELNKVKKSVAGRVNYKKYKGAANHDELEYLFKSHKSPNLESGSIEDISVDKMVYLWTNFARYGNPTPKKTTLVRRKWKPVHPNAIWFLNIDVKFRIGLKPDRQRMRFWDILYRNDKRTRFY